MAISRGPKVVTSGLSLYLDAANSSSYPGSGTTWTDISGNNRNGALTNGPTFNSSNGGSIVFDGTNDFVSVASDANILSTTAYTKTVWFYVTSFSTDNNLISAGSSGQHALWLFTSNKLNAGHNGNWNTVVSTTTLVLNRWYFGSVTFNNTSGWVLYLNGVQEATSVSTTTFTGTGTISIGSYQNLGNYFTGRIATATVYNRVLSSSEILQNYNATKSRFGL
jgi:hypothetical protein